jgi:hypothetical protein
MTLYQDLPDWSDDRLLERLVADILTKEDLIKGRLIKGCPIQDSPRMLLNRPLLSPSKP